MYNMPDDFTWHRFDQHMREEAQAEPEMYDEEKRLELQIEQVGDLLDTADDIGHDAITDFIYARLEELEDRLNELRDEIDAMENESEYD